VSRRLGGRVEGRVSADLVVVLVLFAGLVAFSVYTSARQEEEEPAPAYSTHATSPRGAAALYLWLEELGYRVERIENGPFQVSEEAKLLFVLAPSLSYNGIETKHLQDWVEGSRRTLVLVTEGWQLRNPLRDFGVERIPSVEYAGFLTPTVPLLTNPPPGPVETRTERAFQLDRDDYVAHLQAGDLPVLTSLRWGQGRVILASTTRPFSNEGLADPGSARLIYNLLAGLEPGNLVQFDEVHHGYTGSAPGDTLLAWLYSTPWGWALLYGTVALFGWILLRGRRFGHPVPAPERTVSRPQSEYVVSMAGLFRRGGRRTFVMRHYHDRLKRGLAAPWRVNPDLPDDAFLADLAHYRDDLDGAALGDLLARLSGPRVNETELVRLAGEVEHWLAGRPG
jgi:hypothetical protein